MNFFVFAAPIYVGNLIVGNLTLVGNLIVGNLLSVICTVGNLTVGNLNEALPAEGTDWHYEYPAKITFVRWVTLNWVFPVYMIMDM